MNSPHLPSGGIVVYQGYLFKTPPLDKFFISWKKRWFVLTLLNPLDPSSLDLSYYSEADRKDKRGVVNLQEIRAVNPIYSKSKGNVFSVETEDRKFLLRAPDEQQKAVWVAKLLEGCSKDSTSFHVTVPNQPTAPYAESILKSATPTKINVVSSLNGAGVYSTPFDRLRRIGCQITLDRDILWFETCCCLKEGENFHFFVVNSGIERAYQIVLEYKRSIELALRDHMIMEECNQSKFSYSFVVKKHYGHSEFPSAAREQIISNGLFSLSSSGDAVSLSDMNRFARSRPSIGVTEVVSTGPIPGQIDSVPRAPSPYSIRRSPSPLSPKSPGNEGGGGYKRMPLDMVPRVSNNPGQYSSSGGELEDSRVRMDADPSQKSDPGTFLSKSSQLSSTSWKDHKQKRMTLEDMHKSFSVEDSSRPVVRLSHKKASLADIQMSGGINSMTRKKISKGTNSTEDATGGGIVDSVESGKGALNGEPHKKISLSSYDHLMKIDELSLQPGSSGSRKMNSPAYIQA